MGKKRHLQALTILVAFQVAGWPSTAAAAISFKWEMPERLTGVGTAARDIDAAAKVQPPVIELRSCLDDATWTVDGETVTPPLVRRCTYQLQLPDAEEHQVTLEAGGESFSAPVAARDLLVVSIGDSVASGEGNPDGPSLFDPDWIETRCHRSLRSGAAQAALALEAGSPHSAITFLPLGCSGATVADGLLGPYGGVQADRALGDLPAQVAEVERLQDLRRVDALLLSVGANDVYFASLAQFCARFDRCPQRPFDPDDPTHVAPLHAKSAEEVHEEAQQRLRREYDRLATKLDEADVESARVIIVEYFDPTRDSSGNPCEALLPGIQVAEAEWAQSTVLEPLNAEVSGAASRHGWRFIGGVQEAFAHHGICTPRRNRWIVQIPESLLRGARLSGPLHPNEAGHQATAALIGPVLADAVGFEGGTAAAQVAGTSDDGGIQWLQVLIGAIGGALLVVVAWVVSGFLERKGRDAQH